MNADRTARRRSNATASPSNRRAPRVTATCRQPARQLQRIGIGRAGRDDRAGHARCRRSSSSLAWSRKSPGQAGTLAQADAPPAVSCAAVACRQIERIPVAQLAGDAELAAPAFFRPLDRIRGLHDRPARRAQTRKLLQAVSAAGRFPTAASRCWLRCCRAPGIFAIDDDDVEPLSRQAFGDQRAGDAGADDQRIAFDVLDRPPGRPDASPPQTMANGRREDRPVRCRLNPER